jgi:hypothetical protein
MGYISLVATIAPVRQIAKTIRDIKFTYLDFHAGVHDIQDHISRYQIRTQVG